MQSELSLQRSMQPIGPEAIVSSVPPWVMVCSRRYGMLAIFIILLDWQNSSKVNPISQNRHFSSFMIIKEEWGSWTELNRIVDEALKRGRPSKSWVLKLDPLTYVQPIFLLLFRQPLLNYLKCKKCWITMDWLNCDVTLVMYSLAFKNESIPLSTQLSPLWQSTWFPLQLLKLLPICPLWPFSGHSGNSNLLQQYLPPA